MILSMLASLSLGWPLIDRGGRRFILDLAVLGRDGLMFWGLFSGGMSGVISGRG